MVGFNEGRWRALKAYFFLFRRVVKGRLHVEHSTRKIREEERASNKLLGLKARGFEELSWIECGVWKKVRKVRLWNSCGRKSTLSVDRCPPTSLIGGSWRQGQDRGTVRGKTTTKHRQKTLSTFITLPILLYELLGTTTIYVVNIFTVIVFGSRTTFLDVRIICSLVEVHSLLYLNNSHNWNGDIQYHIKYRMVAISLLYSTAIYPSIQPNQGPSHWTILYSTVIIHDRDGQEFDTSPYLTILKTVKEFTLPSRNR